MRLARRFAADVRLDAAAADHLALVAEEWVANVVEHGRPRAGSRIVVRLRREASLVRLWFSDAGRPFDPRTATFDGPNAERGGGAGLALIAAGCRIASYARRAGRNRLVLEIALSQRPLT